MKTKRDNFVNAAHRLAEAVTDYQNIRNDTVRDGMIQRFEFTFELGWKALKEYMLDAGMQNTLFPFPLGGRVFSCTKPGFRQYTNLSNYVQNSSTHFEAKCGILTLSIREAAIPNR